MSAFECDDPLPGDADAASRIERVIVPRSRDIGGFEVRRALPAAGKRMIGPFIFFDQMGPSEFIIGHGMDVRPHPHIGLSTVTYLFEGEIIHKDSLGTDIPIQPGAINWMTAGKGITHSERTSGDLRKSGSNLFGLQVWNALPARYEETDPDFSHTPASDLPVVDDGNGLKLRMILGEGYGAKSPAKTYSDTVYAHVTLSAGRRAPVDSIHEEQAIYTVSGEIRIGGTAFGPGQLLVLTPGDTLAVTAVTDAQFVVIGGEPMDGPRHIWWNFVSSRKDRIEQAKADWSAGRFDTVPGDAEEFIPLPDR